MLKNDEIILQAYYKWQDESGREPYEDSEYKEIDKEYNNLYNQLKELIPEDKIKLLIDFADINTAMLAYEAQRESCQEFCV
ncbi:MAG TPA: hypothetical protein GXX37_05355 [Clostridiaceae bacterium]|nr:hypothetical protein [Clostridiaceae bacterium]